MSISKERLQELFRYDPEIGRLIWIATKSNRAVAGTEAGGFNPGNGYRYVGVDGSRYLEHRLIWLAVHGVWPSLQIDHINGNKIDNRLENLREATPSQNQANWPIPKNNTSGFKGAARFRDKWRAAIQHKRKYIFIGLFDTPQAASAAYLAKAKELNGEYVRAA